MTTPTRLTAPRILTRCRLLVRPALADAVARLHPWPGEMAAYSLGWGSPPPAQGNPVPGGTVPRNGPGTEGKGLRQVLAVLGAEAAGAPGETAVPAAVAVELIHTFSLLHDDIMDGDETRRRRETVWKAYGTGPAVLAGDALFALAVGILAESSGPYSGPAVRRLSGALNDLVQGQAEDLLFERRPWTGTGAVRLDEYRAMAGRKTGALLGCAPALGATLAGAPAPVAAALDEAGRHLGLAFQIVDDLLGIWGDPAVTGKPVHGDLRRMKKTYPVLAALAAGTPAADRLSALLATAPDRWDEAAVRRAATLVEEAGGRAAAHAEAGRHLEAVHTCLDSVPLAAPAVEDFMALLPYLLDRTV